MIVILDVAYVSIAVFLCEGLEDKTSKNISESIPGWALKATKHLEIR